MFSPVIIWHSALINGSLYVTCRKKRHLLQKIMYVMNGYYCKNVSYNFNWNYRVEWTNCCSERLARLHFPCKRLDPFIFHNCRTFKGNTHPRKNGTGKIFSDNAAASGCSLALVIARTSLTRLTGGITGGNSQFACAQCRKGHSSFTTENKATLWHHPER